MLQTCTRCRNRRIKCDSNLPACANCAKNDLECTFRDDALQEDIPRSYIQSLNERIDTLTSQLALHKPETPTLDPSPNGSSDSPSSTSSHRPLHILAASRPGSDLRLDLSVPSRMTHVVFESLPPSRVAAYVGKDAPEDDYILKPSATYADKAHLVPSMVRFLLARYEQCIKPHYDIPVPGLLNNDGASFKKLPDLQKFKLLMACAIAAAREAYKAPDWKHIAQICRDWADELITPIILSGDGDTLASILLLLVYELADPSRGIIWELLDLAARTCLQLGWHQVPDTSRPRNNGSDYSSPGLCGPGEVHLMSVLKDIEGSLQTIFNRPNILSGSKLPSKSETEPVFELYLQISDQIYGTGRVYENQSCPFVGEVAALMDILDSLASQHMVIKEAWLLFLPVCAKHRQCLFCFQEPDEPNVKGMAKLRSKVIDAASGVIMSVYHTVTSVDGFLPPAIASSRVFSSGCSLTTAILKRWITPQASVRELMKCTEILTMFAPHWNGGHSYLGVWRTILDLLELDSPGET